MFKAIHMQLCFNSFGVK